MGGKKDAKGGGGRPLLLRYGRQHGQASKSPSGMYAGSFTRRRVYWATARRETKTNWNLARWCTYMIQVCSHTSRV